MREVFSGNIFILMILIGGFFFSCTWADRRLENIRDNQGSADYLQWDNPLAGCPEIYPLNTYRYAEAEKELHSFFIGGNCSVYLVLHTETRKYSVTFFSPEKKEHFTVNTEDSDVKTRNARMTVRLRIESHPDTKIILKNQLLRSVFGQTIRKL